MPREYLSIVTLQDILDASRGASHLNTPKGFASPSLASPLPSPAADSSDASAMDRSPPFSSSNSESDADAILEAMPPRDDSLNTSSASSPSSSTQGMPPSPYFLFLLGTDTAYSDGPIQPPKPPENFSQPVAAALTTALVTLPPLELHPLSYMAQLASQRLNEPTCYARPVTRENKEKAKAETKIRCAKSLDLNKTSVGLAYESASVAVVNGPTTVGSNVGDRTAETLLLVLHAIARGKTDLRIAGHSRGAVGAKVLMHELHRVKEALLDPDNNKTLNQILLDTPRSLVRAAMLLLLQGQLTVNASDLEGLKTNLSTLRLSPFLIDPVPGNAPSYVTAITSFATSFHNKIFSNRWQDDIILWEDPDFNQPLPEEVTSNAKCFYHTDERSQCFRCLLIFGQGIVAELIPGNHGTAVGNPEAQGDVIVEGNPLGRLYVRDMVFCKLLEFMDHGTQLFSSPVDVSRPKLSPIDMPGCTVLNQFVDQFMQSDKEQRTQNLIQRYQKVQEIQDWSKLFRLQSYMPVPTFVPTLIASKLAWEGKGPEHDLGRIIANNLKNPGDLTLDLWTHQTQNLNSVLAGLLLGPVDAAFSSILQKPSPVDQVKSIGDLLIQLNRQIASKDGPRPLATAYENEGTKSSFLIKISELADSIAVNYLGSNLEIDQKKDFFIAIALIFALLSPPEEAKDDEAKADEAPAELSTIAAIFKQSIHHHMMSRYLDIKRNVDNKQGLLITDYQDTQLIIQDYIARLPTLDGSHKADDEDEKEADNARYEFLKQQIRVQLSALQPFTMVGAQTLIIDALAAEPSEVLKAQWMQLFRPQEAFLSATLISPDAVSEQLIALGRSYQMLVDLEIAVEVSAKASLLPENRSMIDPRTIVEMKQQLIQMAGRMLQQKQVLFDLDTKLDSISPDFYTQVQAVAEQLGGKGFNKTPLSDEQRELIQRLYSQRVEHGEVMQELLMQLESIANRCNESESVVSIRNLIDERNKWLSLYKEINRAVSICVKDTRAILTKLSLEAPNTLPLANKLLGVEGEGVSGYLEQTLRLVMRVKLTFDLLEGTLNDALSLAEQKISFAAEDEALIANIMAELEANASAAKVQAEAEAAAKIQAEADAAARLQAEADAAARLQAEADAAARLQAEADAAARLQAEADAAARLQAEADAAAAAENPAYQAALVQLTSQLQLIKTTPPIPNASNLIVKALNELITEVDRLKNDGEPIEQLIEVLNLTYLRLTDPTMTYQKYEQSAKQVQGSPSTAMKVVGGLMLALGLAIMTLAVVFWPVLVAFAATAGSFALTTATIVTGTAVGGTVSVFGATGITLFAKGFQQKELSKELSSAISDVNTEALAVI